MKKTIILSTVLLGTLSVTLANKTPGQVKKDTLQHTKVESIAQKETLTVKKLKLFNAKEYLQDHERKKRARRMMKETTKQYYKF
jgi:hypothetical protein